MELLSRGEVKILFRKIFKFRMEMHGEEMLKRGCESVLHMKTAIIIKIMGEMMMSL